MNRILPSSWVVHTPLLFFCRSCLLTRLPVPRHPHPPHFERLAKWPRRALSHYHYRFLAYAICSCLTCSRCCGGRAAICSGVIRSTCERRAACCGSAGGGGAIGAFFGVADQDMGSGAADAAAGGAEGPPEAGGGAIDAGGAEARTSRTSSSVAIPRSSCVCSRAYASWGFPSRISRARSGWVSTRSLTWTMASRSCVADMPRRTSSVRSVGERFGPPALPAGAGATATTA
mmetsp:Transcript_19507/g.54857  ORF Transcript_19507/g.54857 Transcript_19507/m.54857 type:complete len:231 (+) Transcript_19507:1328-2020(+)